MQAPSATAPSPTFFIPKPSHPLSTPFAPTIPLSLHRPTLNRLLWNLFKYFDISPPLTSRAEMICDSWRWARSEELPPTPCLPFPPPSFFVERPIFLFWLPSFFFFPLLLYSPLLLLSAGEGLESSSRFFFFFFPCDSTVWWTNWVIFLYLLTFCVCCLFFFVPFAQCPPTVWSCADTMYGSSEGNPPTAFMWILWGYGATKWLLLLFFRGLE